MTVGGGIRSVDDVADVLRCGADSGYQYVCSKNPSLISDIAQRFGSQCMVLSIEAKYQGNSSWEVYTDNGRERTGKDVLAWAQQAVAWALERSSLRL